MGGGTDLLVTIAEEISRPDLLIDLRTIPGNADPARAALEAAAA